MTLQEKIAGLDLEAMKYQLVARDGWSLERADHVEKMYKAYLVIAATVTEFIPVPTKEIDEFWHQHILDTEMYAADCDALFGHIVHHYPYVGLFEEGNKAAADDFEKTRALIIANCGLDPAAEWQESEPYHVRKMAEEEFEPIFWHNRPLLFSDNIYVNLNLPPHGKLNCVNDAHAAMQVLCYGMFQGDELVGWSFGKQTDGETFEMMNSCIFPEHRRQGLYTSLMNYVIEDVTILGYRVITSRHIATNSAIIIAKLKAGFLATGFEACDQHGILLRLTYFNNPVRKRLLQFRTGEIRPDETIKELCAL